MNARREPEWAMVTVLFADIRGFTAFADRSTAREAVAYLNEFLGLVVPAVTGHGGHTHQLLGDGLLAFFEDGDHADRALASAGEMLAAVEAGMGDRCRMGIGLNSGLVLVGEIGGDLEKLAVIGDPVNVASRVQDATKELGERLLMTEATRALLEHGTDGLRPRGELALKGKAAPVAVYAPQREAV